MHGLRELQWGFSRDIFSEGKTGFGAEIKANGLDSDRRLQIYRNNTYLNFTEALQAAYPVVRRLVGDGFFAFATHHYITRFPATSGDVHEFGADFPAFLGTFEAAAGLPYLPDVARLEWDFEQVYYAAGHPPLDLAAMAQVPEERYGDLKFLLNPASRLLRSAYPVLRIWQINQEDDAGDQTVDLDSGGVNLLVIRNPVLDVDIQVVETGEFVLLQALAEGDDFATACDRALCAQPDFDVPSAFQHHIRQGTFVNFSL